MIAWWSNLNPLRGTMHLIRFRRAVVLLALFLPADIGKAQPLLPPAGRGPAESAQLPPPDLEAFPPEFWQRVKTSVDRGLVWLARQQQPDGSFRTRDSGQPGLTSLCVLAFLSAGHQPGEGPYGEQLEKAVQFATNCQRQDGLISYRAPTMPVEDWHNAAHTATYNHAITGLMLCEVYGLMGARASDDLANRIKLALAFTRNLQVQSQNYGVDSGGWRYLRVVNRPGEERSDLPCTSWQIMFYRSAKNAGFDVPRQHVLEGTAYVKRTFHNSRREFHYGIQGKHQYTTRTTASAGVICLVLGGDRNPMMEQASARFLLRCPFRPYNRTISETDRYHYGSFYMSQAALLLGGETWKRVYGELSQVFMQHQNPDGSWPLDSSDRDFGQTYSTSLAVLALTPPYQLLPIYQR